MSSNDGGPAFPQVCRGASDSGDYHYNGMSLREYLAGQAIAGLDLEEWIDRVLEDETMDSAKAYGSIAMHAIGVADAVIAQLNNEGDPA